jgi:hypothetical protein
MSDPTLMRPSDLRYSSIDPDLIASDIVWKAQSLTGKTMQKMYEEMLL